MYLEYDWTFDCYRPRIGDCFTSVDGYRSFPSLQEARYVLAAVGLQLGRKTDKAHVYRYSTVTDPNRPEVWRVARERA